MVMKRNMMARNLRRSIVKSRGRFIAIAMIIALGSGMFVGLKSTKMDMVATGQVYTDEQNMFDLRLLSSYGWNRDQLEAISALPGIEDAEGVFYSDLIVAKEDGTDSAVYRFYTIPERIDRVALLEGRMPEAADECLADGFRNDKSAIGKTVTISRTNSDTALDQLTVDSFTVVGIVSSPLYMDMNRGNTSVGSGSIANYYYVPEEAFDAGYYTEIHAVIPGEYAIYTQEYNDAMTEAAERIEPLLDGFAQERLVSAKEEARKAYEDGVKEYEDGVRDYNEEKEKAERDLADAYQKLLDGEEELKEGEQELLDAEQQIKDGWAELEENRQKLEDGEKTLSSSESGGQWQLSNASSQLAAKQAELEASSQQVETALVQINAGLTEVNSGVTQLNSGILQINAALRPLDALIKIADIEVSTAQRTVEMLEKWGNSELLLREARENLEEAQAKRDEYAAQTEELRAQQAELNAKLEEVNATKAQLEAQKEELLAAREQIREGRQQILEGFEEISRQRTNMNNQLAAARQTLISGREQIRDYEKELKQAEKELAEGKATLEESREELAQGWIDYEDGKREAEEKFAEAEQELADAALKLEDAKEEIGKITKNDVYVLDRNSNIGYSSLDSSSDIVAGVARVFPVFFLLVAALVCITTMTRMVDEERTQIGTLKALGYSSGAIVRKYLLYAGSSAILGCVLGVAVGSVAFPMILWQAYKIMLFVKPMIELRFDWGMALGVVISYTVAMLVVTWYCCHKALREVPAELIRPKAPAAGKELIIEKTPLWRRLSFLNKVAIRNIFRYRQRLAMMLVGIGGCTALLMTGFGIRDSISRIVDVQFRDVTSYDMEVYFSDGRTQEQQQEFRDKMSNYSDEILFFHQVSGEIGTDSQTRDIYIIAASEEITDYIDFHYDTEGVPVPGKNEVLLSAGIAEMMDIGIGDSVELRNPDMEVLEVTVSGIYENHVYNYAVVSPETVMEQWGREPELQMAYVNVREGRNPNYAGASASAISGVMNVTVSQQLADMVGTMMQALDLVVVVVVLCAGLLAVIVLYNLTNININERIREIATIKVLGFNASETAMYVFKENLVLTVVGALFGIPLGKLLLEFVISQIKIDLIWIKPLLELPSLGISVVLTILCAVIVDGIFYFRLDKINMAEALKSVE